MAGFTKLDSGIIFSTIWKEDDKTRIVWITLLAMSDAVGFCSCSLPGLAGAANVSLEDCKNAIIKLKSPDEYSRSKEFGGRRIDETEGGFLILNYEKYRAKRDSQVRREQNREAQERFRSKPKVSNSKQRKPKVSNSKQRKPKSAQAEAEAEAEAEAVLSLKKKVTKEKCALNLPLTEKNKKFRKPSSEELKQYATQIDYNLDPQSFLDFYDSKGWMIGRNKMKDWQAAVRTWRRQEKASAGKNTKTQKQLDDEKRRELERYE